MPPAMKTRSTPHRTFPCGADLVLIPIANTADEPSELFQWEIKIQAFHSSVFVAMVNRVGLEGKMQFCGESIVAGSAGETIVLAGNEADLLFCKLDLSLAAYIRAGKPYTKLRRTELCEGAEKKTERSSLSIFIKSLYYFHSE